MPSDWLILTGYVNIGALLAQMRYAIWRSVKMGLTGLHDLNGPQHLYIYRSLLGLSTFLSFKRVYDGLFMLCY